ncbi:MAG: MoxR family ATPase [Proteobacteria bacterium]|nr:MoxR family ATPase [Pseudomonadota bacterium]
MASINDAGRQAIESLESASAQLMRARTALKEVIYGQDEVIDLCLTTILAGGHGLIVGAPGLAKTKLASALGRVLGLDEKRVQFTPDLMPADILGSEVLDEGEKGRKSFRFVPGPVFCQLLMADEINRASPRTQSALLQAMQEHFVTVAGVRHDLPQPFHVLATQNPIEQEGTYPLPEAQLDRFIMQIDISYPPLEAERRMLFSTTGNDEAQAPAAMTAAELIAAQRLTRTIPVGEQVADAILRVVRAARPGPDADKMVNDNVAWGPSPRASQALMLGARARALLDGRLAPSIDDVAALLEPVFKHRMAISFSARADGKTVGDVISHLRGLLA